MSPLDEAVKEQIERNRQEALKRLAERQARLGEQSKDAHNASKPAVQAPAVHVDLSKLVPAAPRSASSTIPAKRPLEPLDLKPKAVNAGAATNALTLLTGKKEKPEPSALKPKLQLLTPTTFSITATKSVQTVCRDMADAVYSAQDNVFIVPFGRMNSLIEALPLPNRPQPPNIIPKTVRAAFEPSMIIQRQTALDADYRLDEGIEPKLYESLFPFQRQGVHTAIAHQGRIMIADEMGLGKSIQAIAVASYYRREWPLLILAPASMVASWYEQMLAWLPGLRSEEIDVIYDGKVGTIDRAVTILSYDLAVKLAHLLGARMYRVAIVDECHALRNSDTKRAKTLIPLLMKVDRVVMLSGTPALSRPVELFSQLQVINSRLFPKFHEYGLRYCSGRQLHFGWDWRGSSNAKELQVVLENLVMIRRMKDQVLTQLPRKIRHQIFLKLPTGSTSYRMFQMQAAELDTPLDLNNPNALEAALESFSKKAEYMALWKKTAELKLAAMLEYTADLLESGHKMLIFAHHQAILDGFSEHFFAKKWPYIRIDGRTPPSDRQALCTKFQTDEEIRIALLSITAASTGLTLTKATTVVFAELFFNPGVLVQAEDRAHRIGQVDSVNVHYLLAKGTTDDRIWPLILRKLNTLESVGLGKNDFKDIAVREHDQGQLTVDRFFKKAEDAPVIDLSTLD